MHTEEQGERVWAEGQQDSPVEDEEQVLQEGQGQCALPKASSKKFLLTIASNQTEIQSQPSDPSCTVDQKAIFSIILKYPLHSQKLDRNCCHRW